MDLSGCGGVLSLSSEKGGCWTLLLMVAICVGVNSLVGPGDNPQDRHAKVVFISVGILFAIFGLLLLGAKIVDRREERNKQ